MGTRPIASSMIAAAITNDAASTYHLRADTRLIVCEVRREKEIRGQEDALDCLEQIAANLASPLRRRGRSASLPQPVVRLVQRVESEVLDLGLPQARRREHHPEIAPPVVADERQPAD